MQPNQNDVAPFSRPTVVSFDLGGVLANDIWEHAFLDPTAGIAATLDLDPETARTVASSVWKEFVCSAPSTGWLAQEYEYWNRCIDLLELAADPEELITITEPFIEELPGMLALVDSVRTRARVVLCSNNTEFWYQREWRKLGLARYFAPDGVFLSCRIGSEKSDPDQRVFRSMIKQLGVAPRDILFVDDRQSNVEAATKFGMPSVQFPSHAHNGARYLARLLDLILSQPTH